MAWIVDLYATHPFWIWLAIAGLFLVIEVSTGTGWLLWTAACAVVVALLTFIPGGNAAIHLAVWAVLTIVTTVTARRYLPKNVSGDGPDINDNVGRLIGRQGTVTESFHNGQGRVFVDGKEWAAVAEDNSAHRSEEKVTIVSAAGSVLTVKTAA